MKGLNYSPPNQARQCLGTLCVVGAAQDYRSTVGEVFCQRGEESRFDQAPTPFADGGEGRVDKCDIDRSIECGKTAHEAAFDIPRPDQGAVARVAGVDVSVQPFDDASVLLGEPALSGAAGEGF